MPEMRNQITWIIRVVVAIKIRDLVYKGDKFNYEEVFICEVFLILKL